jgi:hypothetical protein
MGSLNQRKRERGSALVEAAIAIPTLVLLMYWSAAITDVMVLKIKSQEAARFAVWEMTVFRTPAAISADLHDRFADLRSPSSEKVAHTGLMLFPQSKNIDWSANINPVAKQVGLGGTIKLPPTDNVITNFINQVINLLSRGVDTAVRKEQFNVFGYAEATVNLNKASNRGSTILTGGDLLGAKGQDDLGVSNSLANFSFQTPLPGERPMRLVFDSWKAWPKPAQYTTNGAPTNVTVSPNQTYVTVEEQVSAQVKKIAFFGFGGFSWFGGLQNALVKITSSGLAQGAFGGQLPELFSSRRMKDPAAPNAGPLTILPVAPPDVGWAPAGFELNGGVPATNRLGDQLSSSQSPFTADNVHEVTGSIDRSRYTVPYQVNTQYWKSDGGASADTLTPSVTAFNTNYAKNNEYVRSFACRGHYFAGSYVAQQTDPTKRYKPTCNK